MKSIRRSLNNNKDVRSQISTPMPLPPVSKPPSALLPPQKVIKAVAGYRSVAPQELSFQKGDFFYVIKEVDDYYEAHNPVTGARGLVPKAQFEEFSKNQTSSRTSRSIGNGFDIPPTPPLPSPQSPKSQVFYAIVLHDFDAERADELDAKRGDAITVVAQSNREWFVAKPIGRLGRPGLIPASFVEIHDPTTGKAVADINALMDRGDLPRVEDWKKAMFNYKQNSISLGVIDTPQNRASVPNSPYSQNPPPVPSNGNNAPGGRSTPHQPPQQNARPSTPEAMPEGILLSADVVSFHFEMEEYWFRVNALYQPYAPQGSRDLPPARQLVLFRVYNDFYDFQVSLLDTFPQEAGRVPPHPRVLPFMPGPANSVDDALTATRRVELDEYLHNLCDLNKTGGTYILEDVVVRQFLALKPGDVENETDPRVNEVDALFNTEYAEPEDGFPRADSRHQQSQYQNGLPNSISRMRMEDPEDDGSEYGDESYRQTSYDRHPYGQPAEQRQTPDDLRHRAHLQGHSRTGSSLSVNGPRPNSRSNSPIPRSQSPQVNESRYHTQNSQSTSSIRISGPSSSGRTRSQSNAQNFNSPAISAANPQTAFVKIKIYDRVADDLIAIRVHPRVTHNELMDKVQARLGGEVANLRYRDSLNNAFVDLDNDGDLRYWMENTDKLVLYAD